MHKRNLESDCVALLAYLWQHREEEQTYTGLADSTGIPYETIRQMVQWFRKDPNNWALRNYGSKHGYVVRFLGRKTYPHRWHVRPIETPSGTHVSVSMILRGKTRRIGRFRSMPEAVAFVDRADDRIRSLERKIVDVVYVGTTQDSEGKLLVEDVAEYHPVRDSEELPTPNIPETVLTTLTRASDYLSPSELAENLRAVIAKKRLEAVL